MFCVVAEEHSGVAILRTTGSPWSLSGYGLRSQLLHGRHHLSREELHVPPRKIGRQRAELAQHEKIPEPHILPVGRERLARRRGAAAYDQAQLDRLLEGDVAEYRRLRLHHVLQRLARSVPGWQQHFDRHLEEHVAEGLEVRFCL